MLNIFTGKDPHYIDELAQLYYLFDKKELFLQIAEFWCGSNGIVWQNEYDDLEYICTHIASLLNKFNETEFANKIQKNNEPTNSGLRWHNHIGSRDSFHKTGSSLNYSEGTYSILRGHLMCNPFCQRSPEFVGSLFF